MADERTSLDRAVDALVYAPIGLVASVRGLLPQLAARGRQEVGGQVSVARLVGELAVRQGQRQAEDVLGRVRHQAEAVLDTLLAASADRDVLADPADAPLVAPPLDDVPVPAAPSASAPVTAPAPDADPVPEAAPAGAIGGGPAAVPAADELAIPGYDALAASQVVPRLAGLTPAELEAVRAHEAATRRRRTILGRISQLQAR